MLLKNWLQSVGQTCRRKGIAARNSLRAGVVQPLQEVRANSKRSNFWSRECCWRGSWDTKRRS